MPAPECLMLPTADGHPPARAPLTGLPGRATLLEKFNAATVTAQREGKRLGVLLLGLDASRPVAGDPGQRAVDAMLRHAGRCLDASVRGADTVSRLGGREFVILLTDLSTPADAARVAANMLSSLQTPERIGQHAGSLSASIGISLYPDDGVELEDLIHLADDAMCRASREGSGGYVFHDGGKPPLASGSVAERALRDQTAMLARVAHELRNPLTPICVAASLIDADHVEELPQLRQLIERQVDHLSRLVGDLLDLSRAQGGKLRLRWSEVDLVQVVSEAVGLTRSAMEARRQHLVVELPDPLAPVDGDRLRLVQVLTNLLENASKYTPAEGCISVTAKESGADVVVRVSDNGIGIRAEALAEVFQPFVQETHATRFNATGLGIGLTVVRELVEAHGGTVQAFSAGEGQGSQFVLTLPRHGGGDGTGQDG